MLIICYMCYVLLNVFLCRKHGNRISVFLFDNKIRQKHPLDFLKAAMLRLWLNS